MIMNNEIMRKEINEAIAAGERALSSLRIAQRELNGARNWGMFDMLGGGFFSGMIKHSKISDASRMMERAKQDLLVFQSELRDVNIPLNMRMEVGSFLSFADFFFDGFVADYLVQSKIAEARRQVTDAIVMVENILYNLKGQ
jgi:hypothetical protein